MNITPDQARALLANQSERGALWNADWNFTDRTAAIVREDSPGDEVMEILFNGDDTAFSDGDLTLAAAAPDLAQTIAAQKWEYNNQYRPPGETRWRTQKWEPTPGKARTHRAYYWITDPKDIEYRLVRRLVGTVEVAE